MWHGSLYYGTTRRNRTHPFSFHLPAQYPIKKRKKTDNVFFDTIIFSFRDVLVIHITDITSVKFLLVKCSYCLYLCLNQIVTRVADNINKNKKNTNYNITKYQNKLQQYTGCDLTLEFYFNLYATSLLRINKVILIEFHLICFQNQFNLPT